MYHRKTINLGNLLLSLSDLMDTASPETAHHQLRTAFIAWELARWMKLEPPEVERLFAAALLHDAGALGPMDKVRLARFEEPDLETHCRRGELLLAGVPQLRSAAAIVRHHHTAWNTWRGAPWSAGLDRGAVVPSQILHLADTVEHLVDRQRFILHQREPILKRVRAMKGTEVHADVVDAFVSVARREEFWFDLMSSRLYSLLLHRGPFRKLEVELAELRDIGELFRNIVDFRSRFTAAHSAGVAACAVALGERFGFTHVELEMLQMAGNLHDLGKLTIPVAVLEKPGDLSPDEAALFRQHSYSTWTVLDTIEGMHPIAEWAAYHHERLDGSGYPFHRTEVDLDTGARMVAVADVFTALAEDRPYRAGLGRAEVSSVLRLLASNGGLDARLVDLLLGDYPRVWALVRERQAQVRHVYDVDFAPLAEIPPRRVAI